MRRWWILLVLVVALGGCAPKWRVISQAEPNPFVGAKDFLLLPVDYDALMVGKKTEQEFLADKKKEAVDSFASDKVDVARKFREKLVAEATNHGIKVALHGAPKAFVLKPRIGFMEPGFYAVVVSKPSKVILRLRVEDKDGKLLDEVVFEHRTPPNTWANVSPAARYREDAEVIGQLVGKYLAERVSPD